MADDTLDPLKKQLIEYVQLQLGDQIIDVELDPSHYEAAYQRALGIYRQRAENAYEESYSFLQLQDGVNEYILPQEVQQVRQIFRRTIGLGTGGGTYAFDPFAAASDNLLPPLNVPVLFGDILLKVINLVLKLSNLVITKTVYVRLDTQL